MDNKTVWMIEDFIKDAYLENGLDNLQYGTIVKELNVSIEDVIRVCVDLEKKGKIQYQYDIRDTDLTLLHSYNDIHLTINKAKEIFDEDIDIINHIYISIKLTEEYKQALDNFKNKERSNERKNIN